MAKRHVSRENVLRDFEREREREKEEVIIYTWKFIEREREREEIIIHISFHT